MDIKNNTARGLTQGQPTAWNPPTLPPPPDTYSQVAATPILSTSKFITLAGQCGIRASDGQAPTSFLEQVKLAYENVEKALAAAGGWSGAGPRDIIHVRHYIVQDSGDAELNRRDIVDRGWGELWKAFMDEKAGGYRPPDTVLGVAGLAKKGLLYEVEVWAIVDSRRPEG